MNNNYQHRKSSVLDPYFLESLLPLEIAEDSSADDTDFWTYDRDIIASFAEVDSRFSALRLWRLIVARENSWSTWMVFSDKQLTAIADANPSTLDELSKIPGLSSKKISNYGQDVIKVLSRKTPRVLRFDASEAL